MENTNATIVVENWDDMAIRDKIMEEYGDSTEPFFGHNQNGETIAIHVSHDSIVLETLQDNGWVRKNYYYYGEEVVEELFDGKWN